MMPCLCLSMAFLAWCHGFRPQVEIYVLGLCPFSFLCSLKAATKLIQEPCEYNNCIMALSQFGGYFDILYVQQDYTLGPGLHAPAEKQTAQHISEAANPEGRNVTVADPPARVV